MSLFSSIQVANNAIRAQQIGLQVVGQNIANANTPGYMREEVVFAPAASQSVGGLLLGMGVQVVAVKQKVDLFLEERLRQATSDRSGSEVQEETYLQLESLLNELGDTDLSTSLNKFFDSISEILNKPDDVSTRNLAVLQGTTLAKEINRLSARVRQQRSDLNDRVTKSAEDINRLIEEIRSLNLRITQAEGGSSSHSDAVGLRDQRYLALSKLAQIIDIRVDEQPSGAVNVYAGGSFLVFEGLSRKVEIQQATDRGLTVSNLLFADSKSPVDFRGGELAGLIAARDNILGDFLDELDSFATTFAFEFNRVYSQGQGLKGYTQLSSNVPIDDHFAPLDAAGLDYTPVNGSFQIKLLNRQTGLAQTTEIKVELNGLGGDTTLSSLVAQIDAIDGISATITADRRLRITSDAVNQEFSFAEDTSGLLASLGLNTFFTGSSALSLGVDANVKSDPARFAASRSGIGAGTQNAIELARFLDRPLETRDNTTLSQLYDRLVSGVTQGSSVAKATAEGFRVFEETLQGQKNGVSGVSLDEEAVNLLTHQRVFQAAAKYISTLNDLLGLLVNL
jgi:flagellar hook-associated protein 1 FlgK